MWRDSELERPAKGNGRPFLLIYFFRFAAFFFVDFFADFFAAFFFADFFIGLARFAALAFLAGFFFAAFFGLPADLSAVALAKVEALAEAGAAVAFAAGLSECTANVAP